MDAIIVTNPKVVAKIMGPLSREGALDKSAVTYGPVNQVGAPFSQRIQPVQI